VTDESFGARLCRERERRQIALSSIAANTKISLGLLKGLERDDVSRWPSGIFRRSFIRAYAEAAGLDPVAITQEFFERHPDPTDEDSPREQASRGMPLRLTLAEDDVSFLHTQLLSNWRQRCVASVWDFSVTLAFGLLAFLVTGAFWVPLAVGAICYHSSAGLLLGNTPGAFLLGRRNATRSKGNMSDTSPAGACLPDTTATVLMCQIIGEE
jgi:transcriptional regulator with XRE-family HTH domain